MNGQYPLDNPAVIIGSLYPTLPSSAQPLAVVLPPHRRKKWLLFVEALAGAAIMAFAPECATLFTGVFGELLGQALGFALAGAASSIAQQGMEVKFGDQRHIYWKAVGQSALLSAGSAGIANKIGIDLTKTPVYSNLLDEAMKNLTLTMATQALSFATGQQRHFDWKMMLATITTSVANVGVKHFNLSVPVFNDAVANTSSTVASIGINKMYGVELSSEDLAINALGTFLGNQIAAQAKQRYHDYQMKKAFEAQVHLSEIPELRQTLAASEQEFLDNLKVHPSPIGHIEENQTPGRGSKPTQRK